MPTTEEVEQHLSTLGVEVRRFTEPTPTSETAAKAVGCSVGEIAKTVLFIVGDKPCEIPKKYRITSYDCKLRSAGTRIPQKVQMDYDKLMDDESAALRKESAQYKDLILVPMKDYYHCDECEKQSRP